MDTKGCSSAFLDTLRKTLNTGLGFDLEKPKDVGIICHDEAIIAGYLISDVVNEISDVPATVTTDLRCPGWVGEGSLAIVMITQPHKDKFRELVDDIRDTGCSIVSISNCDVSDIDGIEHRVNIDAGIGFEHLAKALGKLLLMFDQMGIIPKKDVLDILPRIIDKRDALMTRNKPDLKHYSEKNVVMCHPPYLKATAALWHTALMKKLRIASFISEYPECDHNELVGWCMTPEQSKDYLNIVIIDRDACPLLKAISESLVEVLGEYNVETAVTSVEGGSCLEKNLVGFTMGEALLKLCGGRK